MEASVTNFFSKTFIFGVCLGLSLLVSSVAVGENQSKSEPLKILSRTADFMEAQAQFSMSATVWEDVVTESGTKLQSARVVELKRRFPNKFRADVHTTGLNLTYAYDGEMITVVQHALKAYGEFTAPDTVRETLDVLQERRGIGIPLEDVLYKRPFYDAAESAISNQYVEKTNVFAKEAHHLAFQHKNIDWQLWVQAGPVPVLLKAVITYKTEQSSPQMIVIFDKWDFVTNLPEYVFDVDLSSDYQQFNVRSLETTK
jgi:hypothetical protein